MENNKWQGNTQNYTLCRVFTLLLARTNPGRHFVGATKFYTLAPNALGPQNGTCFKISSCLPE